MTDLAAALEAITYHRDERGAGELIIHRALGVGRLHEPDDVACWCCPLVVEADDARTAGELLAAVIAAERLH